MNEQQASIHVRPSSRWFGARQKRTKQVHKLQSGCWQINAMLVPWQHRSMRNWKSISIVSSLCKSHSLCSLRLRACYLVDDGLSEKVLGALVQPGEAHGLLVVAAGGHLRWRKKSSFNGCYSMSQKNVKKSVPDEWQLEGRGRSNSRLIFSWRS